MQILQPDAAADRIVQYGERAVRGREAAIGLLLCGLAAALQWVAFFAYQGR